MAWRYGRRSEWFGDPFAYHGMITNLAIRRLIVLLLSLTMLDGSPMFVLATL